MQIYFDSTDSFRRKSRSKTPSCHFQAAFVSRRTKRFNPAEYCVIFASRRQRPPDCSRLVDDRRHRRWPT